MAVPVIAVLVAFFATEATAGGQCRNSVHRTWSDDGSCSALIPGLQEPCQKCVSGGGEFWTYQNASRIVNGRWIADLSQTCCSPGTAGSGYSAFQPGGNAGSSGPTTVLQGAIDLLGTVAEMQENQQQQEKDKEEQYEEWKKNLCDSDCVNKYANQQSSINATTSDLQSFLNSPPETSPNRAVVDCGEAKINIDWVIAKDSGAKNRYASFRANGQSPVDAVISAQAHNPHAQETIRDCYEWASNYLASLEGQSQINQCNEAKINVDWVIAKDAGAKRRFSSFLDQGQSPVDAVISAQAHNPHAQQTIRDCRNWAEAYLSSLGYSAGQGQATDSQEARVPIAQCSKIETSPPGFGFTVTPNNDCDVPVTFSVCFWFSDGWIGYSKNNYVPAHNSAMTQSPAHSVTGHSDEQPGWSAQICPENTNCDVPEESKCSQAH